MKKLLKMNIVLPALIAAVVIATARNFNAFFLWFCALIAVLLGLGVINLVAPLFLWKRHGSKALVPLITIALVGAVSAATVDYGSSFVLSGTAASPKTFIRSKRQLELQDAAGDLLSGRRTARVETALTKYQLRVEVDSTTRVVKFMHYRGRTWYEYHYAAEGFGPEQVPPGSHQLQPHWYFRAS